MVDAPDAGLLGGLFARAKEMQERLQAVQAEAASKVVEATVGGGMVRAKVNGRLELVDLHLEPEILAGGDLTLLRDLILAAVNEANRRAQAMMAEEVGRLTGGLGFPGIG